MIIFAYSIISMSSFKKYGRMARKLYRFCRKMMVKSLVYYPFFYYNHSSAYHNTMNHIFLYMEFEGFF